MRYFLGLFAPSIGQVDQLFLKFKTKPRAARHHLDAIITNGVVSMFSAKPVFVHTVLITFDRAGYTYISSALNMPMENVTFPLLSFHSHGKKLCFLIFQKGK